MNTKFSDEDLDLIVNNVYCPVVFFGNRGLNLDAKLRIGGRKAPKGGATTINLPKGQKLVEATWKEDNLWYLTEPMDSDYVPTTRIFQESSAFGIMEGTVTFVESK